MTDEITLEVIDEKEDIIISKLDELLELLGLYDSKLTEIMAKVEGLSLPTEQTEDDENEPTGQFRAELEAKINEGLLYDQVKEWIISKLEELGIYSEDDVVIKIFVHKTGDMILEVKTRPYRWWGALLQFFQDNMGESDFFETSRYNMKNIMWWRLNKNQQMEDQYSTTDIVGEVTDQWGDNDNIDFNNG